MILCDTNILSTFAKIDQLRLLLQLFVDDELALVPAVYEELQEGIRRGYVSLQATSAHIRQAQ